MKRIISIVLMFLVISISFSTSSFSATATNEVAGTEFEGNMVVAEKGGNLITETNIDGVKKTLIVPKGKFSKVTVDSSGIFNFKGLADEEFQIALPSGYTDLTSEEHSLEGYPIYKLSSESKLIKFSVEKPQLKPRLSLSKNKWVIHTVSKGKISEKSALAIESSVKDLNLAIKSDNAYKLTQKLAPGKVRTVIWKGTEININTEGKDIDRKTLVFTQGKKNIKVPWDKEILLKETSLNTLNLEFTASGVKGTIEEKQGSHPFELENFQTGDVNIDPEFKSLTTNLPTGSVLKANIAKTSTPLVKSNKESHINLRFGLPGMFTVSTIKKESDVDIQYKLHPNIEQTNIKGIYKLRITSALPKENQLELGTRSTLTIKRRGEKEILFKSTSKDMVVRNEDTKLLLGDKFKNSYLYIGDKIEVNSKGIMVYAMDEKIRRYVPIFSNGEKLIIHKGYVEDIPDKVITGDKIVKKTVAKSKPSTTTTPGTFSVTLKSGITEKYGLVSDNAKRVLGYQELLSNENNKLYYIDDDQGGTYLGEFTPSGEPVRYWMRDKKEGEVNLGTESEWKDLENKKRTEAAFKKAQGAAPTEKQTEVVVSKPVPAKKTGETITPEPKKTTAKIKKAPIPEDQNPAAETSSPSTALNNKLQEYNKQAEEIKKSNPPQEQKKELLDNLYKKVFGVKEEAEAKKASGELPGWAAALLIVAAIALLISMQVQSEKALERSLR